MCHATSQIHACGHSATMWTYCRESNLSGKGTAPPECRERTWGKAVKSTEPCSLAFCDFKSGSTWTCCICGGTQNTGGWCVHSRGRWERDDFHGWMNYIDKCEHNCCTNCVREDGELSIVYEMPGGAQKSCKGSKSSGSSKKVSGRSRKPSRPEDVPVPSIESDDREHHDMAETGSKRKGKDKGSKAPSSNKRKK